MEEPETLGQSINNTTEHMNEIVSNINTREMNIDAKKRKLEKIKHAEIERNKHLQTYLEQLSSKSEILKAEESQFIQERKEADEKLSTEIQDSITKIDNNIQTLKKMQEEKAKNEQDINTLKVQINQFEEDLLALEKKDLEAEQVLYEMVTRPFTNEEINHEIQQSENTDKAAVEALLNLTIKTIYTLRQKISEEKKKTVALKDEFHKVIKEIKTNDQINCEKQLNQDDDLLLYYNPLTGKVDMTQYNQVDSRVKALQRREARIDNEIDEINSKKPLFYSKFNEKKLNIEKMKNEKQNFESKLINFNVDFNPKYNLQLKSEISQIQTNRQDFERKLKKSTQKLRKLENDENQLHRTLRSLTELEIDLEQQSLRISSFANENHRIEAENSQREHEEKLKEKMLIDELSDLQKRIASSTAEFDEMIQRHANFEQSILNDSVWTRSNLVPPELREVASLSNMQNFGLKIHSSSLSDLSANSSSSSEASSNFSFTQSDKIKYSKSGNETTVSQTKVVKSKSRKNSDKGGFGLLKVDSKVAKKIAKMKLLKEKIRKESLRILAQVRSLIEAKEFTMKELRVMQAKLHQESFNLQKLQIEASKNGYQNQNLLVNHQNVRTTDSIESIKERMQQVRLSLKEKRNKIDQKSDILHRIEKVNACRISESNSEIRPLFLIEDGERVIDRFYARKRLCDVADRKVNVAQDVLNGFCELYQKIRVELRNWNGKVGDYACQALSEKEMLRNWIDLMQESCKRFRNSGI